ncbi:MAG: GWxTD domain-containing protein, partial [Calditrichia bacterium]
PKGEYRGEVVVQDINANNFGEFSFPLLIESYSNSEMVLSDIELASSISQENGQSEFNKNTLRVIPNPSGVYTIAQPVLYYYSEIYNLGSRGNYFVKNSIFDIDGNMVREFPVKRKEKPGSNAVLVDGFNIITLPSGTYYLEVAVTDSQASVTDKSRKRFILYKPESKPVAEESAGAGAGPTAGSVYSGMNEDEIDREFNYARYIASPEEIKIYEQLGLQGKRQFMQDFWKRKQQHVQNSGIDIKEDYLRRVEFANQNFGTLRREGWQTDRGRVLLTYGKPNDIEFYRMEIDRKPYQVWSYYNLEGGSDFIFADLEGFGEMQLIHSTYSQELQNPNWERQIRSSEAGDYDFDLDNN